ncbi:hypothetical protein ACTXMW_16270 [Brachybacterium paraconglomeratum]|uniref:hypothetical protein n=1 Tax=Brachybacterium paraconglomeratum TaxID=173362 RepID=UPI003FD0A157
MKTFRNTCPDWCDTDHVAVWEDGHTGQTEHKTVISHADVTVDLVQVIEWGFDDDRGQWKIVTHPPQAVLGREFDNAVSLSPRHLRHRIEVLELAQRRLTDLTLEFAKEEQG